jgi:Flp pilus assembly pilin Flp
MSSVAHKLSRFPKSCRGQSLVEYTLILSFISLLSIVLMSVLGVEMHGIYSSLLNGINLLRGVL